MLRDKFKNNPLELEAHTYLLGHFGICEAFGLAYLLNNEKEEFTIEEVSEYMKQLLSEDKNRWYNIYLNDSVKEIKRDFNMRKKDLFDYEKDKYKISPELKKKEFYPVLKRVINITCGINKE